MLTKTSNPRFFSLHPFISFIIPFFILTIMATPVVEVAGFHSDGLAISDSRSVPNTIQDEKAIESVATGELPRPVSAVEALQGWNKPRINIWRFVATNYCFYMMGLNDAAVGVCISSASCKETWLMWGRHLFHMYVRQPLLRPCGRESDINISTSSKPSMKSIIQSLLSYSLRRFSGTRWLRS
jgi:hypothetical protein